MRLLHYLFLFTGVNSEDPYTYSRTEPVAFLPPISLASNMFCIYFLHYSVCVISIVSIFFQLCNTMRTRVGVSDSLRGNYSGRRHPPRHLATCTRAYVANPFFSICRGTEVSRRRALTIRPGVPTVGEDDDDTCRERESE